MQNEIDTSPENLKNFMRNLDRLKEPHVMDKIVEAVADVIKEDVGIDKPDFHHSLIAGALIMAAGYNDMIANEKAGITYGMLKVLKQAYLNGAVISECLCVNCQTKKAKAQSATDELFKGLGI